MTCSDGANSADHFGGFSRTWCDFVRLCVVALVLAISPLVASARAQDVAGAASGPDAALPNIAGSGEVRLNVERFGVGDMIRPGDWSGVRIKFFDSAAKQRDIILRLAGPDPDGDTWLSQRELTANPGVWQSSWLYLRLPFWFNSTDALTLSAYEALDAEGQQSPEVSATGFRPGRLLGRVQIAPRGGMNVVEASVAMAGVIGTGGYGMLQYSTRTNAAPWTPLGHELLQVTPRLEPDELPDRWQGLASYSALVWGSGEPSELRGDRGRALREWVNRGGHLVIILPPVGETWTSAVSNELSDLLPAVRIERREAVDLTPYRPLFTDKKLAVMPKSAVVHFFRPASDALPSEAIPIFDSPDGDCVVVRRLVGIGAVTLIGLDLTNRAFADLDVLEADVFWNRLLGRRGQLEGSAELNAMALTTPGLTSRTLTRFDSEISSQIARTGRSATGVLMGLVVFIAYWLVAGPLGYALLKRKGMVRHAWMAYLGTAGLFTAIAWGGATLLRPSQTTGTHLTLLDHVYGQPVQRARSWFSLLIPRYGEAQVAIGEPQPRAGSISAAAPSADLLWAFDPPWADQRQIASFPDSRGYIVDSRAPNRAAFPVRSTVKQLQADWSGGPRWNMPRPVSPPAASSPPSAQSTPSASSSEPPRLWLDENRNANGLVAHDLPGELEDVVVMIVAGQRPLNVGEPLLTAQARAFKIRRWAPGDLLDLSKLRSGENAAAAEEFLRNLISSGRRFDDVLNRMSAGSVGITDQLYAIAFFTHLTPPDFREAAIAQRALPVAQRGATHCYDLGRWFTQPCIIIVGQMGAEKGVDSPVPITLDGEPVKMSGRTVVRWVYPLDAEPPRYPAVETTPGVDGLAPTVPIQPADPVGNRPEPERGRSASPQ